MGSAIGEAWVDVRRVKLNKSVTGIHPAVLDSTCLHHVCCANCSTNTFKHNRLTLLGFINSTDGWSHGEFFTWCSNCVMDMTFREG